MASLPERNRAARDLFAPLGPSYDRWSRLLSLGQDPRWRRFLVSRLDVGADETVLDVATGTAAVAIELVRRTGCTVVGLDQSSEMIGAGRARVEAAGLTDRIQLVKGSAEQLPFPDASFDGLTFTYLLRYVEDPAATLAELARVVMPGGTIAALEFGSSTSVSGSRSRGGSSRPAGTRSARFSDRASVSCTRGCLSSGSSSSGTRQASRGPGRGA